MSLLILLAIYAGWRAGRGALAALRQVPRSNDDLVFY